MLSSTKSVALLLLLLATLLTESGALQRRQTDETTIAGADETTTPPPPLTTTKATKKWAQANTPSQQKVEDHTRSVKIVFPSTDDSEEESKFDIYGLKTTPPPEKNKVETGVKVNTTPEVAVTETTMSETIAVGVGNSTIESVDDRLGIFNLAPHCPEGHVIVNQRCHKSA